LTAEIALAASPALVLLFGAWEGHALLIASDDQIAAEVAGVALRQRTAGTEGSGGPWEDPLEQHATELELGIALPSQIRPEITWQGVPGSAAEDRFREFAAWLLRRIGVEDDGPASTGSYT
jgi:hypothetical protein